MNPYIKDPVGINLPEDRQSRIAISSLFTTFFCTSAKILVNLRKAEEELVNNADNKADSFFPTGILASEDKSMVQVYYENVKDVINDNRPDATGMDQEIMANAFFSIMQEITPLWDNFRNNKSLSDRQLAKIFEEVKQLVGKLRQVLDTHIEKRDTIAVTPLEERSYKIKTHGNYYELVHVKKMLIEVERYLVNIEDSLKRSAQENLPGTRPFEPTLLESAATSVSDVAGKYLANVASVNYGYEDRPDATGIFQDAMSKDIMKIIEAITLLWKNFENKNQTREQKTKTFEEVKQEVGNIRELYAYFIEQRDTFADVDERPHHINLYGNPYDLKSVIRMLATLERYTVNQEKAIKTCEQGEALSQELIDLYNKIDEKLKPETEEYCKNQARVKADMILKIVQEGFVELETHEEKKKRRDLNPTDCANPYNQPRNVDNMKKLWEQLNKVQNAMMININKSSQKSELKSKDPSRYLPLFRTDYASGEQRGL